MIVNDEELAAWAFLHVTPYVAENVNPASLDLRLGHEVKDLMGNIVVPRADNGTLFYDLVPGHPILATTMECVEVTPDYAGMVFLKSSMARTGLDHALAGWIDPGFCGEITLELHAHAPLTLFVGQRIVQLVLAIMSNRPKKPYNGRYQNQRGPTPARPPK